MSIASNCGAEAAANEIVREIDKMLADNSWSSDACRALKEVRAKAADIASTAKAGWY